jgi:hypothetical protein
MTVAAVGFVPSAPLLIPAVAGGSAHVDQELRAASLEAVARAVSTSPDEVVVVASTRTAGEWGADAAWSFSGFGVQAPPAEARPALPWQLGIGAWLLDECGWTGRRRYVGVGPPDNGSAHRRDERSSVIIAVGDGSARRSERAPGHLDPRAERFDEHVADCLARGDATGLAAIDDALAEQLWCNAVPAWRWVTASIGDAAVTDAELAVHTAPYGVGYFVALWPLG